MWLTIIILLWICCLGVGHLGGRKADHDAPVRWNRAYIRPFIGLIFSRADKEQAISMSSLYMACLIFYLIYQGIAHELHLNGIRSITPPIFYLVLAYIHIGLQ